MTTSTTTSQWEKLAKRLDNIKPAVATFTICDDPSVRAALAEAKDAAAEAQTDLRRVLDADAETATRQMYDLRAKKTGERLAAAQKRFDTASVTLRFKALARQELEALQNAHPASEEQEADGAEYAMDTFAPALIAAASLDEMPAQYAKQALDNWSAADAQALWRAAWDIQHTPRTDLGKG